MDEDARRGPDIDGNQQESESSDLGGLESAASEGNGGGHSHVHHSRKVVIADGDVLPSRGVAVPFSPFSHQRIGHE